MTKQLIGNKLHHSFFAKNVIKFFDEQEEVILKEYPELKFGGRRHSAVAKQRAMKQIKLKKDDKTNKNRY